MTNSKQENAPPAIVFPARQTNSLGVIRSLGKKGIPVIGLDYQPMSVGFFSRYCKARRCPDPAISEARFIDSLVTLGRELSTKGILFLMDDHYVFLATKYRNVLKDYFLFSYLDFELLEKCIDKRKMAEIADSLGIPTPATFWPDHPSDVDSIARGLQYPCIVKPIGKFEMVDHSAKKVYSFFRKYGKALRIPDRDTLLTVWEEINELGFRVIIQEEIAGGPDCLYSLGAYCNESAEILAAFTGRKLRQIPPDFGTCTLAEGCLEPRLIEYGRKFFKEINFWGIAELEFKKDPRDGQYKFLEINPRAWTWISLAEACGVDLPYIAYLDLTKQNVESPRQNESNIRWSDIAKDIVCFVRHRRGNEHLEKLSFRKWAESLRGPRTDIYFNESDPLPGMFIPLQLLRTKFQKGRTSF